MTVVSMSERELGRLKVLVLIEDGHLNHSGTSIISHKRFFPVRRHLKVCSPDNDFSDISGTWATLHASTAPLAR